MSSRRSTTVLPAAFVALATAACTKVETPAQALPGEWTVVSELPRELKGASFVFKPGRGPGQTFEFTPPGMLGNVSGEYAFSDSNRIEVRARGQVSPEKYYPFAAKPFRIVSTFDVSVNSHDEVVLMPLGGTGEAATLKRIAEDKRPAAAAGTR